MRPAKIDGATLSLGAPVNWQADKHGHCGELWVRRDVEDGLPFLRSAWEADAREVGCLLAGAKLQLGICTNSHPVVNLGVGPLPADFLPPLTVQQEIGADGTRSVRVTMYLPNGQYIHSTARVLADRLGPAIADAVDAIQDLAVEHGWPTT